MIFITNISPIEYNVFDFISNYVIYFFNYRYNYLNIIYFSSISFLIIYSFFLNNMCKL